MSYADDINYKISLRDVIRFLEVTKQDRTLLRLKKAEINEFLSLYRGLAEQCLLTGMTLLLKILHFASFSVKKINCVDQVLEKKLNNLAIMTKMTSEVTRFSYPADKIRAIHVENGYAPKKSAAKTAKTAREAKINTVTIGQDQFSTASLSAAKSAEYSALAADGDGDQTAGDSDKTRRLFNHQIPCTAPGTAIGSDMQGVMSSTQSPDTGADNTTTPPSAPPPLHTSTSSNLRFSQLGRSFYEDDSYGVKKLIFTLPKFGQITNLKEVTNLPSQSWTLRQALRLVPVSYTHLTLPTICSV